MQKGWASELLGNSAGFTGTRHSITAIQRGHLLNVLTDANPREVHYGDCTGADYECFMFCCALRIWKISHPGNDETRRMFTLADDVRDPKDNLERNIDIVKESDYLIACPREMNEIRRSGTWMTVRYARAVSRTVVLIYPDGNVDIQRPGW